MNLDIKKVALNTLLIWLATFLSGFIIGFAAAVGGAPANIALIGISNLVITFGLMLWFTIKQNMDWLHFMAVLLALLGVSLFNLFFGTSLVQLLAGFVVASVACLVARIIGLMILRFRSA